MTDGASTAAVTPTQLRSMQMSPTVIRALAGQPVQVMTTTDAENLAGFKLMISKSARVSYIYLPTPAAAGAFLDGTRFLALLAATSGNRIHSEDDPSAIHISRFAAPVPSALARILAEAEGESFDDDEEWVLTTTLSDYLARTGEDGYFQLQFALASADRSDNVIAAALMITGETRPEGEMAQVLQRGVLLSHLDDLRSKVRYGAARGLWALGNRRNASKLASQANKEPNQFVRQTMLAAAEELS